MKAVKRQMKRKVTVNVFKLKNTHEVFGFSKEYSTGDYKVVEKDLGIILLEL